MSTKKHATILAVSDGWEDAYIKDEATKVVYYVAAPDFLKVAIKETVLRSSMAYALLVPEKKEFPSVDVALAYVKKQYETDDDTLIPLSEAVDVILDYAKAIDHSLANKVAPKTGKNRPYAMEMNPPKDQ